MPTIDHKLASQRLQVQGGHRGLNPVLFDTSAAARVRAPQIDPNAANVQFTPVQPGQVGIKTPLEATAEGASKLMAVWSDAATKYADRQHELDATLAISQIKQSHQAYLYGSVDADGKRTEGFLDTRLADTTKGYSGLLKQLDQSTIQILQQLSPGARAKAAIRAQELREQTLQEALKHRQNEEFELNKRVYTMQSEREGETIATTIIDNAAQMHLAISNGDTATQQTITDNLLARMQAGVVRRSESLQYAPLTADPANDIIVDTVQSVLAQENGLIKIAPFVGFINEHISSTDARVAVEKAFTEARDRQLKLADHTNRLGEINDRTRQRLYKETIHGAAKKAVETGKPVLTYLPDNIKNDPDLVSEAQRAKDTFEEAGTDPALQADAITYAALHNLDPAQTEEEYGVPLTEASINIIRSNRENARNQQYQYYGERVKKDISEWLAILDKDGQNMIPMDSGISKSSVGMFVSETLNGMAEVLQNPKATKADLEATYQKAFVDTLSGKNVDLPFVFEPFTVPLPEPAHVYKNARLFELADANEIKPELYLDRLKQYATTEYVKDPETLVLIKGIIADPKAPPEIKATAAVELFFNAQTSLLEKNGANATAMQRWTGATYTTLMTRFFNDLFSGRNKTLQEKLEEQTDRMRGKASAKPADKGVNK